MHLHHADDPTSTREDRRKVAPTAPARKITRGRLEAAAEEARKVVVVPEINAGTASLVAYALDGARFDEIAGTVAGDDTVLIVARSRPAAQRLWLRLRTMGANGTGQ